MVWEDLDDCLKHRSWFNICITISLVFNEAGPYKRDSWVTFFEKNEYLIGILFKILKK